VYVRVSECQVNNTRAGGTGEEGMKEGIALEVIDIEGKL